MGGPDLVLDVRGLTVEFDSEDGPLRAVDDVGLQIRRGEIVGLVGESGAGKSLTSEAILGLIRRPPGRVTGEVWFGERNLLALDEPALELAHRRDGGHHVAERLERPARERGEHRLVGDDHDVHARSPPPPSPWPWPSSLRTTRSSWVRSCGLVMYSSTPASKPRTRSICAIRWSM